MTLFHNIGNAIGERAVANLDMNSIVEDAMLAAWRKTAADPRVPQPVRQWCLNAIAVLERDIAARRPPPKPKKKFLGLF
jgi:hypothetical protein